MKKKPEQHSSHARADPTRAKILKAARKLFGEFGFAGTSVGKIALKANVNHSLIFHHFDNKEGLWKATKQFIVEESKKKTPLLPSCELPFSTFLKELFEQTIHFYCSNPDLIRVFNWQRLERSNKKQIGVSLSGDAIEWIKVLETYQKRGEINQNIKLEFLMIYILSIISSAALDPVSFIKTEKNFEEYIAFCIDSILKFAK